MKFCKLVVKNDDGTYSIERRQERYTEEEFKKIQALMPDFGWILIVRPTPEEITNPRYVHWRDA